MWARNEADYELFLHHDTQFHISQSAPYNTERFLYYTFNEVNYKAGFFDTFMEAGVVGHYRFVQNFWS